MEGRKNQPFSGTLRSRDILTRRSRGSFADRPKNLYFANVSQSIVAGKDSTGVYCASSTMAFPQGVSDVAQLPYNSVIEVSPEGWRSEMLAPRFDIMGDMPPESEKCFVSWLSKHPGALLAHVVDGALRPLCPKDGKLYPCAAFGYRMLEKLNAEGRLKMYIPEGEVMVHLAVMP